MLDLLEFEKMFKFFSIKKETKVKICDILTKMCLNEDINTEYTYEMISGMISCFIVKNKNTKQIIFILSEFETFFAVNYFYKNKMNHEHF